MTDRSRNDVAKIPRTIRQLWSDDGSLGLGCIHEPRIPHLVVTTWAGIGVGEGYLVAPAGSIITAKLALLDDGVLWGLPTGSKSGSGHTVWNPLTPLLGRRFRGLEDLCDALATIVPHVVVTQTGGTYWLVRGQHPVGGGQLARAHDALGPPAAVAPE